MIYLILNPFEDFMDVPFGSTDDVLNNFIQLTFSLIPWIKYIVATIFLLFGILMFTRRYSHEQVDFQAKPIANLIAAVIFFLFAFGFYFDFLIVFLHWIAQIEPPMLIFNIFSSIDGSNVYQMVTPFSTEWNSLNQFEQLTLVLIGLGSMAVLFAFIFGSFLVVSQGFYGKHKGTKILITCVILFFFVGFSPGITLLIT